MVKYKDVRAYEIDDDLYRILQDKFANEINNKKLELIHTDVLEAWNKNDTLYMGRYDLIANLPYYIATNIILNAFEDTNCESIIVMIQKEVAEKFCAKPGEKEYNSLGVITDLISLDSRIIIDVPPSSFNPEPKVDSAVIYIKKDLSKSIDEDFNRFLKSAFSQPRKKLFKNLSSIADKDILRLVYKDLDLDENIRPHELSASLYHQIYKKVILDGRDK
jgi:16S rRNA (adenine1518-N6/adenine1519-N6)-dimethyltransferase